MKQILLFLIFSFLFVGPKALAQHADDYQKQWEQVETFEKKGLYRSAWKEVNAIYEKALQRKDEQQQTKALIYQLKYRERLNEDAGQTNIRKIDSLIASSKGIQKALLQSMLAEIYLHYTHRHRYQLYNRITSAGEQPDDITTWSLPHFFERITSLYLSSLTQEDLLKKIRLTELTVIVDTGKNSLQLQPTLYDLLAHRALLYFTNDESGITRPAEHFVISDSAAFAPASSFAAFKFKTADTSSLAFHAIKLFQQLIGFHLNDKKPDALIDVSLQRLQYVYHKAVMPQKDSLYVSALRQIIEKDENKAFAAQAYYLLAQWYFNMGSQYQPLIHEENRYSLKTAKEIAEKTARLFPKSEAGIRSKRLADQIEQPSVSLKAEQVNVTEKPFRVLVQYKNEDLLWFRIVKLSEEPSAVFASDENLKQLLQKETIRQWQQSFPDSGDYQTHATEMKVEGLPHGRYALIASENENFSAKGPIVKVTFYVSNISYLDNDQGGYLVMNRETGEPLKGARIQMWTIRYNADKRRSELVKAGHYKTDNKGYFNITPNERKNNFLPEINWQNDHLFTGEMQYIPYISSGNELKDSLEEKIGLFTDRSIYRPGQTIYFKGIVFRLNPKTHYSEAVKAEKALIYLFDANGQKIDSLSFESNEFGSFSGSFVIPEGLLNGNMSLREARTKATTYFSVENYKRPSFYLEWDTTAKAHRLGDSVRIKGKVTAYSQAVIDKATVSYQVTRRTHIRYPFPWRSGMVIYPRQEISTITQGETVTDENGQFQVDFKAIPDEQADSSLQPVFIYTVSADVTDINGESHHFSYQLSLGYQSLQLQFNMENKIAVDQLDTLRLSSTNLEGKFVSTPIAISLFSLEAPDRFVRKRYWQQPDQYLMTKKEFLSYFPNDEYQAESDPSHWKKGLPLLVFTDTTKPDGSIIVHHFTPPPGWYALQASAKDKDGNMVQTVQYVQVYDPQSDHFPFKEPLWISTNTLEAQPGEKVSWFIRGNGDVYLTEQAENINGFEAPDHFMLNDQTKQMDVNVSKEDLGGKIIHYVAVKYNRVFQENLTLKVPWKNKQLNIQYETFRNKLLPGAKEQWKMKITGPEGEKVSAELLASMYDASLDAFRSHEWPVPDIYPLIHEKISWKGGNGFSDVFSQPLYTPGEKKYPEYEKVYPSLKWFGYVQPPVYFMLRGRAEVNAPAPLLRSDNMKRKQSMAESVVVGYSGAEKDTSAQPAPSPQKIQPRTNFKETAFFLPQLHTDDSGNVVFSFTMPEALTKWKLMAFAHTQDMRFGSSEKEVVTQKPLMIQANVPRFVRQGDQLSFTAKISNLTGKDLDGKAGLQLTDMLTGKNVDEEFKNKTTVTSYHVSAGQSSVVKWDIAVPENYNGVLSYKVTASAGDHSDGEQNALPVLTNRIPVTETLPLSFQGNGNFHLQWDALEQISKSSTLQPLGLTAEFTPNPVWYAVLALPSLGETERESADAVYNRFYANALGHFITQHIPNFQKIMQLWRTKDTSALKSPLQKNENLKNILLEETPWVQNAQNETAQQKALAEWFDKNKIQDQLHQSLLKLKAFQLSNGGFSWFKEMPDDRYITQRIITGLGYLKKLQAWPHQETDILDQMIKKAIPYLDARMKEDFDRMMKYKDKEPAIDAINIQYLYMRSFFPELAMADSVNKAYNFYITFAEKHWADQPVYLQGMLALIFYRAENKMAANAILRSLSEQAIRDSIKGIHWKNNNRGYIWFQAPLETQSLLIEAFHEINKNTGMINKMKLWLLSQKRTQHWATTRATADAIYALLLTGSEWTASSPDVKLKLDRESYHFGNDNGEAGTSFNQQFIPGNEVTPQMAEIQVRIRHAGEEQPVWGALYFQYLENMNSIQKSNSPLSVTRQISLQTNTPAGPELVPVKANTPLEVGDKVQVRLVVRLDHDLDYVHLKDIRASCMEPLQVKSGYHFENGTAYYSTVTDAAVHFYFPHLQQGTYIFTYPVYITHAGNYAGGLSTLECLYAPEFNAHSEGVEVKVEAR